MTALDLARLKALAQAATQGEWRRSRPFGQLNIQNDRFMVGDADAAYIVNANPAAILHLLALHEDRVREVMELYDRLRNVEAEGGRQVAALEQKIKRLEKSASDASWALNPDRMGS